MAYCGQETRNVLESFFFLFYCLFSKLLEIQDITIKSSHLDDITFHYIFKFYKKNSCFSIILEIELLKTSNSITFSFILRLVF